MIVDIGLHLFRLQVPHLDHFVIRAWDEFESVGMRINAVHVGFMSRILLDHFFVIPIEIPLWDEWKAMKIWLTCRWGWSLDRHHLRSRILSHRWRIGSALSESGSLGGHVAWLGNLLHQYLRGRRWRCRLECFQQLSSGHLVTIRGLDDQIQQVWIIYLSDGRSELEARFEAHLVELGLVFDRVEAHHALVAGGDDSVILSVENYLHGFN